MIYTREQSTAVEAQLASRNSKTVIRTSPHYQKAGKVRIFNVGPWVWTQGMGGLGSFTIPAYDAKNPFTVEEGEGEKAKERSFECSQPLDIWRAFPEGYHIDMNKMAEVETDGEELARSIVGVGRFQAPTSSLLRFGVFIAAGDTPTKREILEANERLRAHRLTLVEEANALHQSGPQAAENITKPHRDAAIATGNGKLPWVRGAVEMATCPACMNPLNPEAAICLGCKTVVNEEKVKALKIPGYERLWEKQTVKPEARQV
jgi:hypothetical protein